MHLKVKVFQMQRCLVPDLFTKSSSLGMRSQNKINCLLGPTKSPTNDGAEESALMFRKIIVNNEIVWAQTILNKSSIMVIKSDLLIDTGFGRCRLFMVSVLDSAGSSQGASPSIVLCCWARYFALTVPLSTHMFKWVLANLKLGCNHLMNLESHPGGVEILPVSSCF